VTTFPFAWDAAFDGTPADNENINLGAGRIRDIKSAVQLRMQVDHSWNGDGNDGKHIKSEYLVQAGDPAIDPGDGAIYTKSLSGNTELFYKDSMGNVVQLTALGDATTFPSGTKMTFLQPAPPSGWTQGAYSDQLVRLVSDGSGGTAGGQWVITGLTVAFTGSPAFASGGSIFGVTPVVNADGNWRPAYVNACVGVKS
jgi:hypothetical protein